MQNGLSWRRYHELGLQKLLFMAGFPDQRVGHTSSKCRTARAMDCGNFTRASP